MHIKKIRRINRNTGTVSIHYLRIGRVDGVIKRTYVPRADLEKAFYEHWRHLIKRFILQGTRKYDKTSSATGKEIRAEIESLGLTMRSKRRMCRSRKNYLTISAARKRFQLLDENLREVILTPGNLLKIDRRADSILHGLRARGQKGASIQDGFMQALEEHLELG